jgi:hypothetical protein
VKESRPRSCIPAIDTKGISTADVRYMIETRGLFSKGIGFIDAQLIASCIATHGTQIWTIDRPLGRVAESLSLRATPS